MKAALIFGFATIERFSSGSASTRPGHVSPYRFHRQENYP